MKTMPIFQKNKRFSFPVPLQLMLFFLLNVQSIQANEIGNRFSSPDRDSIIVTKSQVSKKYKIRLYPNATHEVLFFSANGEEGKLYELFVFDMDGKLVKRIQVRNRETTLVKTFQKGSYLFEVFSNDERIENGSMLIN
jgi:hypothetical protein